MKRSFYNALCAISAVLLAIMQSCVNPEPTSITLDKDEVTIPQEGASVTVKVTATAEWSLTNSADWLRTSITGGKGSSELVLSADANTTDKTRSATVNFICGDMKAALTVTQPGLSKIEVNVNTLSPLPKGSNFSVEASCTAGTVTVAQLPDWIILESSKDNTFAFSAKGNYTGAERTGLIVFAAPGASNATVTVQQGGITPVFDITPSSISIGKSGGNVKVTVRANLGYHTEGVSDWIEQKSSRTVSVDGDERVYEHVFSIAENTSGESRTGVISFCNDAELCIPLVVEQGADEESGNEFAHEFFHKSLFMRFTATWCGYCPRMAKAIASAKEQLPDKIEQVCIHGYESELQFSQYSRLEKQYNIQGYPTGIVDGRIEIDNYEASVTAKNIVAAVEQTGSTYPVATGIAMSTSLEDGKVTVQGKVFVKDAGKYKITALILEDDIDKPQTDYAGGNHASYIHNDVARVAMSDVKGDDFTIKESNSVYEFIYTGAIDKSYNPDKLRVLVYTQREFGDQPVKVTGNYGGYYVDNAATVAAGDSLELKYADQ